METSSAPAPGKAKLRESRLFGSVQATRTPVSRKKESVYSLKGISHFR
ncbi:hypothetical protein NLX67_11195 [Domibacillus sp. A3M-37]|nr:hypothetical protein [Domibacillus sp. A3M-37]